MFGDIWHMGGVQYRCIVAFVVFIFVFGWVAGCTKHMKRKNNWQAWMKHVADTAEPRNKLGVDVVENVYPPRPRVSSLI